MSENSTLGVALLVVVGLGTTGLGGYMWLEQGEQINSYEPTEATVVSADVDSGSEAGEYYPDITYEYTVDGETYRNSNLEPGIGRTSKSRTRAEEIVENRPEGETITVYYDPENPSDSYVLKNRSDVFTFVTAFGVLFTVLSVAGLVKRLGG